MKTFLSLMSIMDLMAIMTITPSAFASELFTTHNCSSGKGDSKATVTIQQDLEKNLTLTISLPTNEGPAEISGPATMSRGEDGVETYSLSNGFGQVQVITSFGMSPQGTRLGFVIGGSVPLGAHNFISVPRLTCN